MQSATPLLIGLPMVHRTRSAAPWRIDTGGAAPHVSHPIMKRAFFLLACMTGLATAGQQVVAIQPLGKVRDKDIAAVKAGLETLFAVKVLVLPEKPLPESAWYKPRQRYKADALLDALESGKPKNCNRILGLTVRDISVTNDEGNDWGIFGLGQLGGSACVVSTFRLRAGKADEEKFSARLVKVVNHEVGHTFGLDHCPQKGCLMQAAGGKIATVDAESGKPCNACAARLPSAQEGG